MRTWIEALRRGRWGFEWRYLRRQTPWDTQTTPPEVMAFIRDAIPGRALDLGCGTGTNAITLARRGWEVTGVDFSARAIQEARRKAGAEGVGVHFIQADVTDLHMLTEPFDYALDIGCLFALGPGGRGNYAEELARLMKTRGRYMLYARLPREDNSWGISPEEVESLLRGHFSKVREAIGEEKGRPSAWYWYERR
jgi:SAM-dependent methyltransferase